MKTTHYLINFIRNNKTEQRILKASCGDEAIEILFAEVGQVEVLVCESYRM